MKTKKIFLFSVFRKVVPAEYETWFEQLALEGWFPQNVKHTSCFLMTFVKGTPKKYRYVVDLQAAPKSDYISTYKDFGWEFVGRMSTIYVWRKEYSSERPEAFSDTENIRNRNRRFTRAISFSFAIFTLASLIITICFLINIRNLSLGGLVQFILGLLLSYSIAFLLASVMHKISKAKVDNY